MRAISGYDPIFIWEKLDLSQGRDCQLAYWYDWVERLEQSRAPFRANGAELLGIQIVRMDGGDSEMLV